MKRALLGLIISLVLVSSLSAQEEYFGKNKVQYKSFDWHFIQSPNFDLYYYEDQYQLAKFAITELESAYVVVSSQLNTRLRRRIPVFLYNSPNEFQQTNITASLLPEGVGGFTESFKNRVVIPFNGSYEDFRHVLHHELTHAVTFDFLYSDAIGSLVSRQYLYSQPLWFAEGFAEYSSRSGWDYWADMIVRDATINGYLIPLDYLGGYLAYKEGQAAIKYLADRYGEEKIYELLVKSRQTLSTSKAMKETIGLTTKEFHDEFTKWLKRIYWPEIAIRQEAPEFAKQLTDHEKDGSYFNEKPVFSPDGDKIAIFSDKSDYTEIYLISAIDGTQLARLVKGERSGDLESLHSYVSGMDWSPDGKQLAFVAKSHGEDALMIFNVEKKKIEKKIKFGFGSLLSPAWGRDDLIACTGVHEGRSDIYLVNPENEEWRQLTKDRHDDKDLAFSPDGRTVAFASDRPIDDEEDNGFDYGTYNIFLIDVETGDITTVTHEHGLCRYPTWSPDGSKLCYVSNLNGIDNLYVKELDSDRLAFPITNILTGINWPTWSPEGDRIAFSAYHKGGYDIFTIKDIKPITKSGEVLVKTKFFAGEMVVDHQGISFAANDAEKKGSFDPPDDVEEMFEPEADSVGEGKSDDYADFVFVPEVSSQSDTSLAKTELSKLMDPLGDDGRDTLYALQPDGEYPVKKYKPRFSPDLVTGGVSYDAFYGLRGQSAVLISDYLGNHQFYILTDVIQSISNSNIQLVYLNNTSRVDFGVGLFHFKRYYTDPRNRLFSDRVYGLNAAVWYPFSVYRRIQLDLTHQFIDRTYYDPPFPENADDDATVAELSLIHDAVLWGLTGPVNGSRWKFKLERSIPFTSQARDYLAAELDYRKYWHIKGAYSFALRFAGGYSLGADRKTYFLGGTTNYIGSVDANPDAYSVNGFYYSKIATPLRGYDYFEFSGTRYSLMNLELRYPFLDYFALRFPLPIVLSRVSGAAFLDLGAAWERNEELKLTTSRGETRLVDLKAGFGFGMRLNLGFFLLRYDLAWPYDLAHTGKARHYFSFGAEF